MRKDNNIIKTKSKEFAIKIILLYKEICSIKQEYTLSKQLLRCGTSIGANVAEAVCAISKKDFLAKMYIAFKECSETIYWLDLLHETNYICTDKYNDLIKDANNIRKLLASITKTTAESLD